MIGRALPVVLASGLLILSGVMHGLMTDRWGRSEKRAVMASRLAQLPPRIGEWASENLPVDPRMQSATEADAILQRRYMLRLNDHERIEATMVLLSGRAAPISVHTPDVCFVNSGFRMESEPAAYTPVIAGRADDSFWHARFSNPRESVAFDVYWAWSDGGNWRAAVDPRTEFARSHALCKIYLVCPMTHSVNPARLDPVQRLLIELLPELHRCLSAS